MIKLWRSLMMGLTGYLCSADKCEASRHNEYCNCARESPKHIITPFGFSFVSIIIIIFITGFIIEIPARWLINKKIRKKESIGETYIEKIMNKIENYVEKLLNKRGIKLYEIDPKKVFMAHKSPPTEREEYIYYKYCIKSLEHRNIANRKNIEKNKELLSELIELRDKKHEHYLILKLGKIK
jgi:hypothetical protein